MKTSPRPRKFAFVANDLKEHEEFTDLLSPALERLPDHVFRWTKKNVVFVLQSRVSPAWYLSMGWYQRRRGVILLTDGFKSVTEKERLFIIAHEIAHAYLRHQSSEITNVLTEEEKEQERQANQLAKSWVTEKREGRAPLR